MGVTHAASHPTAVDDARAAVQPDDLMTIIYTSGTTGRPRGCRLLQRNYAAMARIASTCRGSCGPAIARSSSCRWPTASRASCRTSAITGDMTICFATGIDRIRDRPRRHPAAPPADVPRLLETAHAGLLEQLASARGARRRLGAGPSASASASRTSARSGQPIPPGLAPQHRLAERLLFRRVRAGFGGEIRTIISGGAALDPESPASCTCSTCRCWRATARRSARPRAAFNRPHRYRVGTVGPALPHVELRSAEDGEIETARAASSSTATTATTRPPRPCSSTAGCAPATSATIDDDGFLRHHGPQARSDHHDDGKNVAPQRVEGRLKARPTISQAVVLGDRRAYLVALVTAPTIARRAARRRAARGGRRPTSPPSTRRSPRWSASAASGPRRRVHTRPRRPDPHAEGAPRPGRRAPREVIAEQLYGRVGRPGSASSRSLRTPCPLARLRSDRGPQARA